MSTGYWTHTPTSIGNQLTARRTTTARANAPVAAPAWEGMIQKTAGGWIVIAPFMAKILTRHMSG